MEAERGALFHIGREEGCEAYAVAFLEPRTAFVVLSVSPLRSTFTEELAAGLRERFLAALRQLDL